MTRQKSKGSKKKKPNSTRDSPENSLIPDTDQPDPYTHFPTTQEKIEGSCIYLGSYFANKPLSRLTTHHGFAARIVVPTPRLPKNPLARGEPTSSEGNNEILTRFSDAKLAIFKHIHRKTLKVRCLIDETTSHSFVSKSLIGQFEPDEDIAIPEDHRKRFQLVLGPVLIPGTVLVGVTDICLLIDNRSHIMSAWVMDTLFPSHPEVDIQIVLGREFLRNYPGLTMKPTYLGVDSVDLTPWSTPDGKDVRINEDGELLIYVCGYSEEELSVNVNGKKLATKEKGGIGVFFGPASNHNMQRLTTFDGEPLIELAVLEGIIYALKEVLHGRWIEGSYTYTSIHICINSQEVFKVIGSKEMLKKHREADWKNKNGKLIKNGLAFRVWDTWVTNQISIYLDNTWMKEEVLTFSVAKGGDRSMKAAYVLAASGARNSDCVNLGEFGGNTANKWEGHLFTLLETFPSVQFGTGSGIEYKFIDYEKKKFINTQAKASKVTSEPAKFDPSQLKMIDIKGFYPSKGIISIFSFWHSLEKRKLCTASQIFAVSEQSFIEEVIQVAEERGRLMNNIRWGDVINRILGHKENSEDTNGTSSG